MKKTNKTRIGGQAVIEGVMMRGKSSAATAIRGESGDILIRSEYIKTSEAAKKIKKIPLLRGVYNFVLSMKYGIGTLNKSAAVIGGDEEPTKFEKWLSKALKRDVSDIIMVVALVIGLILAVALFVVLPQFVMELFKFNISITGASRGFLVFLNGFIKNFITGIIRITIFLLYLVLISGMNDIKRVFAYHGAEHKVINCFEYDLPLTVENAKRMTVKHERCGTTFIFLVMLVSVLFFSFFGFDDNVFLRVATRIVLLPVVAGIAYEVLIFSAKHDNLFFRILRAPGMAIQKLTTREPSDDMLEVSLTAFKTVLAMDNDGSFPVSDFDNTVYLYSFVRDGVREGMKDFPSDESDWIMCHVLKKGRASLPMTKYVYLSDFLKMKRLVEIRKTGMPLQRVFGYADFYGYEIEVNADVLVPRPETELLVDEIKKYVEKLIVRRNNGEISERIKILDLCTGSGAIAIALGGIFKDRVEITASDISRKALETAIKNARKNGVSVEFVLSDMFKDISGGYDIIVCNPPYIRTADIDSLEREVRDFDPREALDGGPDGLDFYMRISEGYAKFLKEDGVLFLEAGQGQTESVASLFKDRDVKIVDDYNGIKRMLFIK
ncbi:MAG: peptide chain release factor N(5)-glutamine methyltransferase [Clostridiales bacterium]|jgi:release factor-specific protein-(glutamine-N5) methyltransferase|nr:peptide chain release factor N(5)-glutamine methyltransferase [Clostridiales bacterium]